MSDDIERHGALEARLWVTHNSKHVITPTIRALLAERDAAVARAEAAEAEAQRLREGIERFVPDCACGKPATTTIGGIPTCGDDR